MKPTRWASSLFIVILAAAALGADARERRPRPNDSEIVLLKRVVPAFPLDAYAACIAGYALVEFTIDANGDVTDVTTVESDPPGVFDAAAMAAVSQWKFSPRIVNGVAVPQRVSQNIDFSIMSECEVDAVLPDDLAAVEAFDDGAAREKCMKRGGGAFGYAELNFRVDESGRAADVTVVHSTSGRFAHMARDELAERSFDPRFEALTFSHVFAFCLAGE